MSEPAEPGSLAALRSQHGPRYRWLLLMAVMVGTIASVMSSTIVNVAIPDMSRHFTLGQDRAQWVTSGFMAAMTASMLTTPWLLSRFGYRAVYAGCMWLLMAGGLLGGLSNDYTWVLVARVAEGLAAGVVQPIAAIIILRAFAPHEQGRASGLFGTGVVLAPALGPSVGGLLVEFFGWRSIFFMVVPFCLACLWLARRYVPTGAPGGVAAGQDNTRLDWLGLLLATLGTVSLLNGLVALNNSQAHQSVPLLGAAAALVLGFLAWQRHLGRRRHPGAVRPLMDLKLFQHRQFAMGCLVSLTYGGALFGSTYLLPVYMQVGHQLAPALVGTILLPAGIVLAVTIPAVGHLADHQPAHRLVSGGLLLLAASFALMVTLKESTPLVWMTVWSVLGRIGLGFILPSLNLGAMRGMPHDSISQGSSTVSFVRMLGGAAGVSLCGVALQWRLSAHGVALNDAAHGADRLAAFNEVFLMLAGVCTLAMLAAWNLRPKTHHPPGTT
ncbi:MAG TPA: DHA2 family efflux MFS transporter permease subunit [Burkholderiaceae bacterium]|nr:DHA2 family efflux MFS transporter permease subunit [Burkholderiaceae bacterium]